MTDFADRIRPNWSDSLQRVIALSQEYGRQGVVVFDLDSTVFDNRPRQSRIVREFGAARGIAALTKCAPEHWVSGWDLEAAMVACGLSADEAKAVYKDAKAFWVERFFTSEYAADDVCIPGSAKYLHAIANTGVQLAYVTGRHEEMRAGSVKAMVTCGMPTPGNPSNVSLLMKPTLKESDDEYKRVAHATLESMGKVLAAFDNEPTHANDYATRFPGALVIHLATDHSGRPVMLADSVISVPHFEY